MRVDIASRQAGAGNTVYAASSAKAEGTKSAEKDGVRTQEEILEERLKSLMEQQTSKASSGTDSRVKSSSPDDSVGQLAAALANAETRMDVLQVQSKAIRALANLKASSAMATGEEKEKIAKQIRRMEKLMKRIQKKLKHLAKEEQLELRRQRAEKKQEFKKVEELRKEIQSRRRKRRRDEKRYAMEEIAQDEKESMQNLYASMGSALGGTAAGDAAPSFAAAGYGGEAAAVEGASLDISV